MSPPVFPRLTLTRDTLVLDLGVPYRVLSCAIFGGGFTKARYWVNQQVYPKDLGRDDAETTLQARIKSLGLTGGAVGMMTGAHVKLRRTAKASQGLTSAYAVSTAGLKNGLMAGARGTIDEAAGSVSAPRPGTINLVAVLNQPLTDRALVEALGLLAQARTVEVMAYTGGRMSGSGTDSLAVACPIGGSGLRWAGMHTATGEVLGRAARAAVRKALAAWVPTEPDWLD